MSSWRTRPGTAGAIIGAAYALAALLTTHHIQEELGHELPASWVITILGLYLVVGALHAGFDERRSKR